MYEDSAQDSRRYVIAWAGFFIALGSIVIPHSKINKLLFVLPEFFISKESYDEVVDTFSTTYEKQYPFSQKALAKSLSVSVRNYTTPDELKEAEEIQENLIDYAFNKMPLNATASDSQLNQKFQTHLLPHKTEKAFEKLVKKFVVVAPETTDEPDSAKFNFDEHKKYKDNNFSYNVLANDSINRTSMKDQDETTDVQERPKLSLFTRKPKSINIPDADLESDKGGNKIKTDSDFYVEKTISSHLPVPFNIENLNPSPQGASSKRIHLLTSKIRALGSGPVHTEGSNSVHSPKIQTSPHAQSSHDNTSFFQKVQKIDTETSPFNGSSKSQDVGSFFEKSDD